MVTVVHVIIISKCKEMKLYDFGHAINLFTLFLVGADRKEGF